MSAIGLLSLLNTPLALAASNLTIPKPTDTLLPPPPAPDIPPSAVHLTVDASLAHVDRAIAASVDVHHYHEGEWIPAKTQLGGKSFGYQYYLWRGPQTFESEGNRVRTTFPDVRYRLQVRMTDDHDRASIGACGYGADWPQRLRVHADSALYWKDDWGLHTQTRFSEPIFETPCRLAPLEIDATSLVAEFLNEHFPPLAAAIDHVVLAQVETERRAALIWSALQAPIEIQPGTWLTPRPSQPRAGTLTVDGNRLVHTSVSMIFTPSIIVGPKPIVNERPLPPLATGPLDSNGFHLVVPMLIPYNELSALLGRELIGETISLPLGSDIRITKMQVYGSHDRLISAIGVSGGVNGDLYLQGQPVLTDDGQAIVFHRFDFAIDTSNLLVKATNQLMHDKIRSQLLPNTRLDLRDRIHALRTGIERNLTRALAPGIMFDCAVTTLKPVALYPVSDGLEIQFIMDGALTLTIQ
ncbi:MAG: DUF4403 family protein [Nitrospira sp.]|nr:DUF4403 family protein [Nitrospira sp.]